VRERVDAQEAHTGTFGDVEFVQPAGEGADAMLQASVADGLVLVDYRHFFVVCASGTAYRPSKAADVHLRGSQSLSHRARTMLTFGYLMFKIEEMGMDTAAVEGLTTDLAGLASCVGKRLGPTAWTEITQDQVNTFADLTGDHNFLHVDPERARETPFGSTIAHGYLSLSLLAPVTQLLQISDAVSSVNYGLDKLRFPAPVPVGAYWRGTADVTAVDEIKGGMQAKMQVTLEVQGSDRPSVAAEALIRFYA
jgi:acyl dehydratase